MITVADYELRRCTHEHDFRQGVVVTFQAHANAHFLAASLQDYARQSGNQSWGCELEDDGVFTVRIQNGWRLAAMEVVEEFGELLREVINGDKMPSVSARD